jgi:hypothetical protein
MDELTRERYPTGMPRGERPVRIHVYAEDPKSGPDHRGDYRCTCGLSKQNGAHRLRVRSDEERAAEARRIGER